MDMKKIFFKLVCIEINSIECIVLEDINSDDINKVCRYIKDNIKKHPFAYWELHTMVA